jgi:hypothetical protein
MCNLPFLASADEEIDHQWVVIKNTFVNIVDAASIAKRSSLRPIHSDSCLFRQGMEEASACLTEADDSDLSTEASAGESRSHEGEEDSHSEGLGKRGEEVGPVVQPAAKSFPEAHSFDVGLVAQENARLARENAAHLETLQLIGQSTEPLVPAANIGHYGFVPVPSMSYLMDCSQVPSCFQQPALEQVCAQFSSLGPAQAEVQSEAFSKFGNTMACSLKDARTTVMLRNLPNNYTQAMVLKLLESKGFGSSTYNFFYLPIDFQTRVALGYAFVDLAHPSLVQRFWEVFDGFSDWVLPSRKVCFVSWCEPSQGVEAHIERYRNSPVMHDSVPDEHKPLLLENGCRVPFPEPTKAIRAPRIRPCRRQQ